MAKYSEITILANSIPEYSTPYNLGDRLYVKVRGTGNNTYGRLFFLSYMDDGYGFIPTWAFAGYFEVDE